MTGRLTDALFDVADADAALAREFRRVSARHVADADVHLLCQRLASQCDRHVEAVLVAADRSGEHPSTDGSHPVQRQLSKLTARSDKAGLLLLRDLKRLYVRAQECSIAWTVVEQGAKAERDQALVELVYAGAMETGTQCQWIKTRLRAAAPQALAG
jgi:hypothetical protein